MGTRKVAGKQSAEYRFRYVSCVTAAIASEGRVKSSTEVKQLCQRHIPEALFLPPGKKRCKVDLEKFLGFLNTQDGRKRKARVVQP